MKNISYHFDKEKNILVSTITNVLVIEDIINHYKLIENDESFPRNLKVLIQGKDFLFNIKGPEIKAVSEYVISAISKYKSIKEAIVLENSYSTAIGYIFEEGNKHKNYLFKVFSSKSSAQNWLNK
jgi:methyl coenzyme M reductase beta subunit